MKLFLRTGLLLACLFIVSSKDSRYVVDVSHLLDGSDVTAQSHVRRQLDQHLREDGFVVITGHGLPEKLASGSFDAAHRLFDLDGSSKQDVAIKNDNTSFGRGYLGFGLESGLSSTFEPKEGFSYGNARPESPSAENLLSLPNKWPFNLHVQHISIFNELYNQEVRVANLIVSALSDLFSCSAPDSDDDSTAAPVPRSLFEMIAGGAEISLMRLFHYFHQQSAVVQQHLQSISTRSLHTDLDNNNAGHSATPSSMLGSSPHTDWGFLTLILADAVGGLQFIPKGQSVAEENWVDVPYVEGSLVVNGGDYLKLISRGVYHSPIHRVLSPGTGRTRKKAAATGSQAGCDGADRDIAGGSDGSSVCPDRYSFVFFFYPSYSAPVTDTVLNHCTHYLSPHEVYDASETTRFDVKESSDVPKEEFNTLLKLEVDGEGEVTDGNTNFHVSGVHQFGDYVVKKWKGVYRSEEVY